MGVCFFRSVRVAKVHLDQDCKGLGEFVWDFDLLKRAEERERGGGKALEGWTGRVRYGRE